MEADKQFDALSEYNVKVSKLLGGNFNLEQQQVVEIVLS
jgi:hypothetical protein